MKLLVPFLTACFLTTLGTCVREEAAVSENGLIRVAGYTTLGQNFEKGFQVGFADKKCRKFLFSGWNSREVVETVYGIAAALPVKMQNKEAGKDLMSWILDQGQLAGMNVMRFFGHGWREEMVFQISPGVYNEEALKAMDWVLAEAGSRGIKLVVTLADDKSDFDSRKMYARAAGKDPIDFYTDTQMKEWFKANIRHITRRRNTVNGKLYKHDDAILAWNLLNELSCNCDVTEGGRDCEVDCGAMVDSWIDEMAHFLKQADPNHLVAVGEEGFYSAASNKSWVNPDAFWDGATPWAQKRGQNFISNHNSSAIDYLGVHMMTDKWGLPAQWFQSIWLNEHAKDAWSLNKPLVIEEFGKIVYGSSARLMRTVRDPFLEQAFEIFMNHIDERGPMQGVAFTELDAAASTGREPTPYGVRPEHTAWTDLIDPFSRRVKAEATKHPLMPYCVPGPIRSMDAIFYEEFIGEGADLAGDNDVYYTTHGPSLDSISLGIVVGDSLTGVHWQDCMQGCESVRGCIGFRYNPKLERGTCVFYTHIDDSYFWNPDGWQAFYKQKAYRNCYDIGCKFCNHDQVCVKCEQGNLVWDIEQTRPVCSPQPSMFRA